MRILLVQPLDYFYHIGGASKCNRILMEGLAERGHSCRVVFSSPDEQGDAARAKILKELAVRGIKDFPSSSGDIVFHYKGVEIHAATDDVQLNTCLRQQSREFEPTWTLVSDFLFTVLGLALKASPSQVVYIAHTSAALPFGPASFSPNPAAVEYLQQTAGIISVSGYIKEYIRRWGGQGSTVISFPVYGPGPFPRLGYYDKGFITMINPSEIKGLSIFLELAKRLPNAQFAAVPTWATTDMDRSALKQLPNVRLLGPSDDIDDIFVQTRVLLVPSLWIEAFGLVVVEAMLRGIPVLASNVGGLPEAKLGVNYLLPVRPIERYEMHNDGLIPVVPVQDINPWLEALQALLSDRGHYERISEASREAALAFVSNLGIEPFEEFLGHLPPASSRGRVSPARVETRVQ